MTRVYASSIINAPVAEVWAHIRDFNALPKWHPGFVNSRIEDGRPGDSVGCIRVFDLADGGGTLREQLLALSDIDRACTYSILSSPMPLHNYVAILRLHPVIDGDATFIEWSSNFETPPDQEEEMVDLLTSAVYQAGFNSLKQHFTGR